jgi:hypothetical protein
VQQHQISIIFALFLTLTCSGCIDEESVFTDGRIEDLCNGAIPVCDTQASCMLGNDDYYRGSFPGGLRVFARSQSDEAKVRVRFLLTNMLYPGTELHIQVRSPDCARVVEEHPRDIDFFDLAGDNRILEYILAMPGKGDHLVEVFSDMNAEFLMTITIVE